MIVVKLIGGLGNQMFQIAFARALSLKLNESLFVDISAYKKYKIRNYALEDLFVSNNIKDIEETDINIKRIKIAQKIYHIYQKIYRMFLRTDRIGKKLFNILSKRGLIFNFDNYYYDLILPKKDLKSIYGYFQSEKYFKEYSEVIKCELRVKKPITKDEFTMLKKIKNVNAVGVSIRIGNDYLKSRLLNVCDINYYYKAMELIKEKVFDPEFFIFSDDINKVKKIFDFSKFKKITFIEGFTDSQNLRLLYSCKHFIIANSSFSWWGAYLAEYCDKIIIAPSRWYNTSKYKPDIYNDQMQLIEV